MLAWRRLGCAVFVSLINCTKGLQIGHKFPQLNRAARRMTSKSMSSDTVPFGPFPIHKDTIFFESSLSYGIVNLKPILPGHVLIIPKRVVPRFAELTEEEMVDLYSSVYKISPKLESHYGCSALNIAMQDGKDSGQSVPHVHVHMLPRKAGDFKRNDDVYEKLEDQKLDKVFVEDEDRKPRTQEAMAAEARELRSIFT